MRKHLILTTAAALTMGGSALAAEGVSYNFVQGGLVASSADFVGDRDTGIGIGIAGEAGIWEFLYGFANVSSVNYSLAGGDITFTPASLGVGAHMPVGPVDLFGGLSLERIKLKLDPNGPGSTTVTDSGVGLTAGARGVLADNIHWSGSLKYSDLDDLDSALTIGVSGHYYFRTNMAVGINLARTEFDASGSEPETSVLLNFRYDFSGLR